MPYLRRLKIIECTDTGLSELPHPDEVPVLYSLGISQNSDIYSIPHYKYLKVLDCSHLILLNKIPEFSLLESLNCSYTNINIIPKLPNLKMLYCSECPIETLPDMPKLEVLHCDHTNISKLDVYPRLEELEITNTAIKYIPKLLNLKLLIYNPKTQDIVIDSAIKGLITLLS
jgi:Leucine-rich repeat (LRR) protein